MKFAARLSFVTLSLCLVTACGKFSADNPSPLIPQNSKVEAPTSAPAKPWTEEMSTQLEADIKTLEATTPDETWAAEKINAYDVVVVRTQATVATYAVDIAKIEASLPAKIEDLVKKRRTLIDAIRKVRALDESPEDL